MIALYPIKPVYIEKILTGAKKYELRKRLPRLPIKYMVLYSTYPVSRIVGYAKVRLMHSGSAERVWDEFWPELGVTKLEYDGYFSNAEYAHAIEFSEVNRFKRPFTIAELGADKSVPQSFCYLTESEFKRLSRRRCENVWKEE